MRNQVDFSVGATDELNRFLLVATNPDVVGAADQAELCLKWYDPRLDPDRTTNCGDVSGPGLLPAPYFTARMIEVAPLRFFFMIDDSARPFIMTGVRVEWVLGLVVP